MPYEYLLWLTIIFSVLFGISFILFLWKFIERKNKKHILYSVLCLLCTGLMIVTAVWSHSKYIIAEKGIEIERYTTNLDQLFLDYYKESTKDNLKYEFKMIMDTENYITINKIDELFSNRYVVIYHLSNSNIIHLEENEEVLDEKDMEG